MISLVTIANILFRIRCTRSTRAETLWEISRCLEYRCHLIHPSMWLSSILWRKRCQFVCPNLEGYIINVSIFNQYDGIFISYCDIYNALKIYSGEFEFDSPYWDEISVDAKEFIRQLMCVDVDKRLSCEEALEHAW